jgi:hypothetical protein
MTLTLALARSLLAVVVLSWLVSCQHSTAARDGDADGEVLAAAPFQTSALTFVGTVGGKTQAFTFERFKANLRLRDAHPVGLSLSVDMGSPAASDPALKERLARPDVFDPASHPRAVLDFDGVREVGGTSAAQELVLDGHLELMGRVHSLSVPARMTRTGSGFELTATTSISAGAWLSALGRRPEQMFDQDLQVQARLVFPAVAAGSAR